MGFFFQGSETIDSTSSHEDYSTVPLCTENDCEEVYRTARKGRQVGRGVCIYHKTKNLQKGNLFYRLMVLFGHI